MTRDEAVRFLRRNPRIASRIHEFTPAVIERMDHLYLMAEASNLKDARTDILQIIKALKQHEQHD